jgi:hypothetical protein
MSIFYMIVSIVLLRRMKASQAVNKRTYLDNLADHRQRHLFLDLRGIARHIFVPRSLRQRARLARDQFFGRIVLRRRVNVSNYGFQSTCY